MKAVPPPFCIGHILKLDIIRPEVDIKHEALSLIIRIKKYNKVKMVNVNLMINK